MEPIISVKKLNFTYNKGKENQFQALTDIDLEVYAEEFVILFGPSGCGKSTLLHVIAGLEKADNGVIIVSGKDVSTMTPNESVRYHRKNIGIIYQSYNLIHSLSVIDNVSLPQLFLNVDKKKRDERAIRLLERFDIDKQAKKIPAELSGGQQQRIGIARAIVNNPDIILADEPIGNLDSVSAKNVLDILKELNEKEKKTILLVTHNPEFIDYGDRVAHMKDGLITQETVVSSKGHKYMMAKGAEPKEPPTSELENIMRVYKGMTPEQINIIIMPYKAKTFALHFITDRNMEEIKIFEDAIHRRLLKITSTKEFFKTLNLSYQEGGVGFDKRTAEKIVKDINNKIKIAYLIYRKFRQRKDRYGRHKRITHEERIEKLIDYLLRNCWPKGQKEISGVALRRFREALADRLFYEVSKVNFFKFLDKPLKEGGVGLHSHAAKRVTEEIELLLILGYGAQAEGVREMSKPDISKSIEDQKAEIANKIGASRKL